MFTKIWSVIYLLACFTSPYFYAWIALSGVGAEDNFQFYLTVVYESIFALNIIKKFLTDYVPDGDITPEQDLTKIADRYLQS
jgi:hypothetical protein